MAEKKNKNRTFTFRLTDEEAGTFEAKLAMSRMSKSEFFREVFINSNVNLTVNAAPSKNQEKLIFLYNKSSNNLNQLTYKVNSAYRSGIISPTLYQKWINELISIRQLLANGVEYVD